jgi:RNA polymerase sigma-70 factor (ECF subfamily)
MSRAVSDVPDDRSGSVPTVSEPGTIVELVSTTGAREPAVLIYRSAALDDTAFAPCETSSTRVYGLAVRIGLSATTAVEAAGEPCTEVWRTSTRFDADRSSAIAWIMAIAHRRAVDRLRAVRDPTSPAPVVAFDALGRRARRHAHQDRHSRQDQATHAEALQVREALARLDPEQREALELAYFEGYSTAEPVDLATVMSTIVTSRLPAGPAGWPPDREAS